MKSGAEIREKTRFRENRRKSGLSKSKEIEGKSKEHRKDIEGNFERNITRTPKVILFTGYKPNLQSLWTRYCCRLSVNREVANSLAGVVRGILAILRFSFDIQNRRKIEGNLRKIEAT